MIDPADERTTSIVHAILAAALIAIVLPLVIAMQRGAERPTRAPGIAAEPTLALVLLGDAGARR